MEFSGTEWSLQRCLTRSWLSRELVSLGGEDFFLAAWEVMTDYRVNDSRRQWNLPSIDFVFLDRQGRMALVELKREIRTPRDGWSAVCQVTHRAHVLADGFTPSQLESVYVDCRSGLDGRAPTTREVTPLLLAHARAFDQLRLKGLPGLPIRRFVMAEKTAPSFVDILAVVNAGSREQVVSALSRYKPTGEIERYLALPDNAGEVVGTPVRALTIDEVDCLGNNNP